MEALLTRGHISIWGTLKGCRAQFHQYCLTQTEFYDSHSKKKNRMSQTLILSLFRGSTSCSFEERAETSIQEKPCSWPRFQHKGRCRHRYKHTVLTNIKVTSRWPVMQWGQSKTKKPSRVLIRTQENKDRKERKPAYRQRSTWPKVH